MTQLLDSSGNPITRPNKNNPKVSGVYMIHHIDTDKVYVGSTNDLYNRENKHRGMLKNNKHSNKNLQDAFNVDNNINFLCLDINNRDDAFEYEQQILDDFLDSGLLFNVSKDAKLPNNGLTHSDETKQKMSDVKIGKVFTTEHKQNLSLSHSGRIITDTQKECLKIGRLAILKPVIVDNVKYDSITETAKAFGIHPETVSRRIKNNNFSTWNFN
jgi:group I intron endonuclease